MLTFRRFSQVCRASLQSAATHITTAGRQIMVTMLSHSISGFEYKETLEGVCSLEQHFTDNVMRKGLTHTSLSLQQPTNKAGLPSLSLSAASQSQGASKLDIVLGADKNGQVFGIDIPRVRRHQSASTTVFELRLPQCVTKFASGAIRAPWHERAIPVIGVLEDDTVGAATDGTIYHFTFLTNEARLLLKFLENLVRWNERQDQILEAVKERESARADDHDVYMANAEDGDDALQWPGQDIIIDPEYIPGEAGQRLRRDQYGINGDLLLPLLQRDERVANAMNRLHVMLARSEIWTRAIQERSATSSHTGNEKMRRWRKFEELAEKNFTGEERPQNGWMERCTSWLEEILRPVL